MGGIGGFGNGGGSLGNKLEGLSGLGDFWKYALIGIVGAIVIGLLIALIVVTIANRKNKNMASVTAHKLLPGGKLGRRIGAYLLDMLIAYAMLIPVVIVIILCTDVSEILLPI